jgi:hypothetical protein
LPARRHGDWQWLRGYNRHTLSQRKERLAVISSDRSKRVYVWQAGTQRSEAVTLANARVAALSPLRLHREQIHLFV